VIHYGILSARFVELSDLYLEFQGGQKEIHLGSAVKRFIVHLREKREREGEREGVEERGRERRRGREGKREVKAVFVTKIHFCLCPYSKTRRNI
jgi:hypothetical protein